MPPLDTPRARLRTRPAAERRALRSRSHSMPHDDAGATRPPTPWTVRIVQGELLLLGVVLVTAPTLVAVLLVSLALISLDGHAGLGTLAVTTVAGFGMAAAGGAACTGIIFLTRGLGRGSRRAWVATLATAVLVVVLAGAVTAVWLAPQLSLSSRSAAVVASPAALAALLLIAPPTLRSVFGAPRRGIAQPIAQDAPRAAA